MGLNQVLYTQPYRQSNVNARWTFPYVQGIRLSHTLSEEVTLKVQFSSIKQKPGKRVTVCQDGRCAERPRAQPVWCHRREQALEGCRQGSRVPHGVTETCVCYLLLMHTAPKQQLLFLVSVGQELKRGLAGLFWPRVSHHVVVYQPGCSHLKADWGGASASVVVHSRDCRLVLVGRTAGVTSDTWAT